MIKKIDIQISNVCNRKCKWCPAFSKYEHKHKVMTEEEFSKIINIIKENHGFIDRDFKISMSRYNESLVFYDKLVRFAKIINKEFPKATLTMHTNFDFVDKNKVEELSQEFDLIIMNSYDNHSDEISISKFLDNVDFEKIVNFEIMDSDKKIKCLYNDCLIEYNYNRGQTLNIRNRGGSLTGKEFKKRNAGCDIIGKVLEIDVDGDVYPCCEVTGMIPSHKCMKIGNIFNDDFSSLYNNLINKKEEKHVCEFCNATLDAIGIK